MRPYITLIALLFAPVLHSQVQADYQPLSTKPPARVALLAKLEKRYTADLERLPKANRKDLESIYTERYTDLTGSVEAGLFLFGDEFNAYYQTILDEIFRANPGIPAKDIRLLISRDPSPNALCLGEGTLLLNVGLVRRLENEGQIAFVLCHELAHYTLNHVNNAIQRYVENRNAKKTQQEIRDIARSAYGRNEKALRLLQGMVFSDRRHSRLFESQADSLALIYLRNTAYDEREALRCLALLDEADQEKYPQTPNLRKAFDTPEYPFKDAWLKTESTLYGGVNQSENTWNADSLKTHPDCKKRIELLEKQNFLPGKPKFIQPEIRFRAQVETCDFEIIQSNFDGGDYGACLYQTLLLLDKYPDNGYLHGMIGRCLCAIGTALQQHDLGNHVELPAGDTPLPYRSVLTFIHNLRTREVVALAVHYLNTRQAQFDHHETFLFARCQAAVLSGNAAETKALKKQYLELFPRGIHAAEARAL